MWGFWKRRGALMELISARYCWDMSSVCWFWRAEVEEGGGWEERRLDLRLKWESRRLKYWAESLGG